MNKVPRHISIIENRKDKKTIQTRTGGLTYYSYGGDDTKCTFKVNKTLEFLEMEIDNRLNHFLYIDEMFIDLISENYLEIKNNFQDYPELYKIFVCNKEIEVVLRKRD